MGKNILMLLFCCFSSLFLEAYIESHVTSVKKQSDSGAEIKASNKDLRGAQLKNLNAKNADFRGAMAQPCEQNSTNTTLGVCVGGQTTNMSGADFSKADFTNGIFRYVDFAEAIFKNAIAYNADFSGSYFKGANFTGFSVINTSSAVKMLNVSSDDAATVSTEDDVAAADPKDSALLTSTTFCNATMPDGTICTKDLSIWTDSSSGQVFACGCDLLNGVASSSATTT